MNLTLFKATTKANWVIGCIFLAVMFMYLSIIVSMYDPHDMNALNAMLETLPKELVSAMGFGTLATDLTSFIANYYYGFIIIMFPTIYCIIVANRLVARHVDRGSMAYLLSTPNSRLKIVSTQAMYLLVTVALLFGLVTIAGIGISEALFPGQLDMGSFVVLNLCALLTFFAISGICFFFSCIFNDTKYSLAFGGGLPIAFFVINMLSNVSPDFGWLSNLTLFSLFNPSNIIAGDTSIIIPSLVLAGVAAVSYLGGIFIFKDRDLPL